MGAPLIYDAIHRSGMILYGGVQNLPQNVLQDIQLPNIDYRVGNALSKKDNAIATTESGLYYVTAKIMFNTQHQPNDNIQIGLFDGDNLEYLVVRPTSSSNFSVNFTTLKYLAANSNIRLRVNSISRPITVGHNDKLYTNTLSVFKIK